MAKWSEVNVIAVVALLSVTGCANSGGSAQRTPEIAEAMLACGIVEPPATGGKYSYDDSSAKSHRADTVPIAVMRERVETFKKKAGHAAAAALLADRWGRMAEAYTSMAALEVLVLSAREGGNNPYDAVDKTVWNAYFASTSVVDAECTGLVAVLN